MNYEDVLKNAKIKMAPKCRVCKVCNGIVCRGEIPGVGGKGSGNGFIISNEFLSSVKINMDVLYESTGQDTKISLFGKTFEYPIFAAPIGGMNLNYNGAISEKEYNEAIVHGTISAGCAGFTGDGPIDDLFVNGLNAIRSVKGLGIPTLKPWENKQVLEKVRLIEEANAMAFAMDVDSAGLVNLSLMGKPVYPKSVRELKEISSSTKLPFIIKGIMTEEGAKKALEAGAYGIVVSSHGGRVLDDTPAPCSVLPGIKEVVKDKMKIFVDGGIRSGGDVFKALALGADAVLIGRTYAISAFGGGAEGVEMYTKKIGEELRGTMLMTGCNSLKDITRDKIIL